MVDTGEAELIIAVVSIVLGTPLSFYIKDYLVDRANYKKFKETLERTAGLNAEILYSPFTGAAGMTTAPRLFKVSEITKQGLVLKDDMNTIFVPKEKILMTDIVLPSKDYDSLRRERMKKDFSEVVDAIFPPMIDKFKEVLVTELLSEDSEMSAVVGVRIVTQLREAGIDPEKILEKKPTIKRILEEMDKDKSKGETDLPEKAK